MSLVTTISSPVTMTNRRLCPSKAASPEIRGKKIHQKARRPKPIAGILLQPLGNLYNLEGVAAQSGSRGCGRRLAIKQWRGAIRGTTTFQTNSKSIEVFWRADGWWWWWSRVTGHSPDGAPIGPFLTSTEAYLNARERAFLIPRPTRLDKQGPAIT